MKTNYPNIRYHIYRELSKYHKDKKEERSLLIDDISIPVFSGVMSSCVSTLIKDDVSLPLFILGIIAVFVVTIFVTKCTFRFYRNVVKPYLFPLNDQSKNSQKAEAEGLAAKFNYEVSYLITTAYSETLNNEPDPILLRLKIIDACFYMGNAIRKTSESLLAYSGPLSANYVSRNKIRVVMDMAYATIAKLRDCNDVDEDCIKEISNIQIQYDNISKTLMRLYEVKLRMFANV